MMALQRSVWILLGLTLTCGAMLVSCGDDEEEETTARDDEESTGGERPGRGGDGSWDGDETTGADELDEEAQSLWGTPEADSGDPLPERRPMGASARGPYRDGLRAGYSTHCGAEFGRLCSVFEGRSIRRRGGRQRWEPTMDP